MSTGIEVSEKAVFARCKRKLWRDHGLILHLCPLQSSWLPDLGRIYMTDERNHISGWSVASLEELARSLGALRSGERISG